MIFSTLNPILPHPTQHVFQCIYDYYCWKRYPSSSSMVIKHMHFICGCTWSLKPILNITMHLKLFQFYVGVWITIPDSCEEDPHWYFTLMCSPIKHHEPHCGAIIRNRWNHLLPKPSRNLNPLVALLQTDHQQTTNKLSNVVKPLVTLSIPLFNHFYQ